MQAGSSPAEPGQEWNNETPLSKGQAPVFPVSLLSSGCTFPSSLSGTPMKTFPTRLEAGEVPFTPCPKWGDGNALDGDSSLQRTLIPSLLLPSLWALSGEAESWDRPSEPLPAFICMRGAEEECLSLWWWVPQLRRSHFDIPFLYTHVYKHIGSHIHTYMHIPAIQAFLFTHWEQCSLGRKTQGLCIFTWLPLNQFKYLQ